MPRRLYPLRTLVLHPLHFLFSLSLFVVVNAAGDVTTFLITCNEVCIILMVVAFATDVFVALVAVVALVTIVTNITLVSQLETN